ncbi:uncharacterized protein LY89DRAFT_378431 [Mollisia scopiformis]|uniref:Uncharacterized protein n=1 Tax=Mollisia scopiformis TaxID=149040 RepID=A0A194XMW0_MOLSC|nr:uncharacterized protein LY89DRAFT_378431 [Mollisia scopiformis]KUJ21600.1 hypothetical protein LY89DRAFT_378431 [Mollisia scopiformis]
MKMRFVSLLQVCLWGFGCASIVNGYELQERDAATPPECSSTCLATYIPEFCGSISNVTCACTHPNVTAAVSACALQSCNVLDILQLERYTAVSCGIENDKSRLNMVLHVDYTVPFLTFCFLTGRIVGRLLLGVGLGSDDWTMVAAFISYLSGVGTSLGLVLNGFGQHTYWLTENQIITALKFFYITELAYTLTTTLTKLSLLLFFLRIFPNRQFRLQVQILSLLVILTGLSLIIALAFQCIPFSGYWTNWSLPFSSQTKCINQYAALYAGSGLSIVLNLIILLLPIPTLWKLELSIKRKVNVLVMFSVGSGVIVFSLLRLPSLRKLKGSSDISYDQAPIIVFSHLELSFGIICACLPACRTLLEYFLPALKIKLDGSEEHGDDRYEDGSGTVTGGGKSGLGRSRRNTSNTSSKSLVELRERERSDGDVDAEWVKNGGLDLVESGKHGMSRTDVTTDTTSAEEQGRMEPWQSKERRKSANMEAVIFKTVTVEQSHESREASMSAHAR